MLFTNIFKYVLNYKSIYLRQFIKYYLNFFKKPHLSNCVSSNKWGEGQTSFFFLIENKGGYHSSNCMSVARAHTLKHGNNIYKHYLN